MNAPAPPAPRLGWGLAWRIARRELRGGLKGFRVFLICLTLGVLSITAIATLRASIQDAMAAQGRVILGGDAELRVTYRAATSEERAFLDTHARQVSEVVEFRSMLRTDADQALTQAKAVDAHWPLTGAVELDPPIGVAAALAGAKGRAGIILDPLLIERMGLTIGDSLAVGTGEFTLMAALISEPDSAEAGFGLGPRSVMRHADAQAAGLLREGAMFDSKYRLILPEDQNLERLKTEVRERFGDTGARWRDRRNAAPGIDRFVTSMGSFLVLVGLAGLAVGGIGISAAVRAWLEGKTATIATLKTLGASSGLILRIFLMQIGLMTAVGLVAGLVLGTAVLLMAAPLFHGHLPFALTLAPSPRAMAEAAFYGLMITLIFTLLPLARAEGTKAARLYRGEPDTRLPPARALWMLGGLLAVLLAALVWLSGRPLLALSTAGGVVAALGLLTLVALGLRRVARAASKSRLAQGRPVLRTALSSIGAPRSDATAVILSLGLGLTVLACVGQIDSNLRRAIDTDLPKRAPAFFFVDIQPDQIADVTAYLESAPGVSRVDTAPMLRGAITKINGEDARKRAGAHWVVRGDRGLTYAATPPEGSALTQGHWWAPDHRGTPQVSFGHKEAEELGIGLGDQLTINVLGREITAEITSLRDVNFASGGMNFVMILSPSALEGAPHSNIATVYTPPEGEAAILRHLSKTWPNITAIGVRDAIARAREALSAIASATAAAAAATLLTGFAVLLGAAAAGERARAYEAAILKVLGASRRRIQLSFALRAGLTGAAAGLVAVGTGVASAWIVMRFVMEVPYRFEPVSAAVIILSGLSATLIAGLIYARRPLAARPARVLRAQD